VQVGAEVAEGSFKTGDRVMALLSGGGYAEEVRMRRPEHVAVIHYP